MPSLKHQLPHPDFFMLVFEEQLIPIWEKINAIQYFVCIF